jgi:major membrane immunogen (membrane-anchored lipoprotein)
MSELGDLQLSKLRFYSVGVVAENKALSSKIIQVTPIENVPFVDGTLSGALSSTSASGSSASGAYTATANASNAISATWLPLSDPNRMTAPDVRRGEMVIIYQFGDQNKYWWCTMKDDHNLRRLETVVYGISAVQTEDTPLDSNNMYWFEWSSHKKVVHLHTSKANGEPFSYDLQIDAGKGVVTITDDIGNIIQLNSEEHRIELKNTDGSHYDMHKKNLTVTIPETTKFETKDFLVNASNRVFIDAVTSVGVKTKDTSMTASNSFTSNAPTTTVVGSGSITVTGGDLNMSGDSCQLIGSNSVTIASPATSVT